MKNTGWTCLPWAFAKVIDRSLPWLIDQIGHDGSDEPYMLPGVHSGFHQQECIEVLQKLGYACTPIEVVPQIQPYAGGPVRQIWFPGLGTQEQRNDDRFAQHLKGTVGVLTGLVLPGGQQLAIGHAVAWCGKRRLIFDSRKNIPTVYPLSMCGTYGFTPNTYWKVQRIHNVRTTKNGPLNSSAAIPEEVQSPPD